DLLKNIQASESDALLVLACGAGVQSIGRVIEKPLIAALDPVFIGTVERLGVFHEYCSVCGNCVLDRTEGLCPVTRCAKSLMNGPCGGAVNGKCEVDFESDCVWALIYEKKKKNGTERSLVDKYEYPKNSAKIKSA